MCKCLSQGRPPTWNVHATRIWRPKSHPLQVPRGRPSGLLAETPPPDTHTKAAQCSQPHPVEMHYWLPQIRGRETESQQYDEADFLSEDWKGKQVAKSVFSMAIISQRVSQGPLPTHRSFP